ncbi:MFS general substrate transporter [Flagelloscypha sp. PMI_526]|nr:MFS general substrate transporter [Flagelloscypha sp. PMI_526]
MSTTATAPATEKNASETSSPTLETSHLEKQEDVEQQPEAPKPAIAPPAVEYPDGGLEAWLVVLGGVICNVVAFGYVTSYGVFQSYYEQFPLRDQSPSNIAWIGSIQAFMLFFPGLFGGALFDAGWFRLPLFLSSAGLVLFTFLLGQATKYYQFVLCQGIASGFAGGMLFSPVMTVVGHWWFKKRGLVFGLIMLGSSIGGVTIPIMVRRLIHQIGFPWTMRTLGFLFFGLLIIPNLTLKRRLPTQPKKGLKAIWDHTIFSQNLKYSLYILGGFFAFLGLYVVMIFLDISAVTHGVPEGFSFYLIAILNGVSGVGRMVAGKLSDKYGPGNAVIPSLLGSAAITFAFPFAKHKADFILIAVFFGLVSGGFIATFMLPVYVFGEMKDLGKRMGMGMTFISFAALGGTPIAGELIHRYGYTAAGYFGGATMATGVLIIVVVRYMHLKGEWTGRF